MALLYGSAIIRAILQQIDANAEDIEIQLKPLTEILVQNQAVTALTDILATCIDPQVPVGEGGFLTTFVSFNVAGAFYTNITNAGHSELIQLNDGLDLFANNGYMFDIAVTNGDTVNFQHGDNCTLKRLLVLKTFV